MHIIESYLVSPILFLALLCWCLRGMIAPPFGQGGITMPSPFWHHESQPFNDLLLLGLRH